METKIEKSWSVENKRKGEKISDVIKRRDENTGLSVEHKSRDYGRNEEKDREKSRMAETEL